MVSLSEKAGYCFKTYSIASVEDIKNIIAYCDQHPLPKPPSGYTDEDIWITLSLSGDKSVTRPLQRIVELDAPLLDFIELYVLREGALLNEYHTGDKRPFDTRPIVSHNFRFPLTVMPGTQTTLVFHIRSSSGIKLPLTLYEPSFLAEHDVDTTMLSGIFYGILFLLSLYNLIFFFILKKPIYLFYVGFVTAYAFMQLSFDGLAARFLWPDQLWLNNAGVPFFADTAIICAILFGQSYLRTKTNAPRLHRVLDGFMFIALLAMLLLTQNSYAPATYITAVFAMLTPLVLIVTSLLIYKTNPYSIRLYLLAWSFFFIGTVLMASFKLGLLPPTWWILHSQQIGVLFKVIILSYALGAQLQSLMYVDQLTGIWNRRSLQERFELAKHRSGEQRVPFALISVDIDDFKTINDSLSHKAGDILLKQITKRLKHKLRSYDTLVRLGQDEFVIIVERLKKSSDLTFIANTLLNEIKRPFSVWNHLIHITTSMGISVYPQDGETFDTLIKNSSAALHKAKAVGKKRFMFYDKNLEEKSVEKLALNNDMFGAIERNEFFLLYQPKIAASNYALKGFEALIRWNHPTKGLISPDVFIPVAEQNDQIVQITAWIIDNVCNQMHQWKSMGLTEITVAVNITAKDLNQPYFVDDFLNRFQSAGLPYSCIELELTERMLIEDNVNGLYRVNALAEAGIAIAIDDFGTGYSSFSYLQNSHIHTLKIDKSFIDHIQNNHNSTTIVSAMISLGHHLGMQIVAEGVETEEQLRFLTQNGCDQIQGYYFDKPLDVETINNKYITTKKDGYDEGRDN